MSQRRRQARLQSLRFTGPPPPPRLYGLRPACPVPAAGASPRRSRPPRLGARRARLPPAAPGARAGARPPRGAPGRIPAGSLELEPRVPAPLLPSPPCGSHPGRRRRRPERGAGQTAHGRALVPAWRRACARSRGFRPRAPRSCEPGRAQSSPSSTSRPCLTAESPASGPQCVWLGAWHRHPDPRGQRGQKALSPPSHPALGFPENISQCPSLQRDAALPHEPAWGTLLAPACWPGATGSRPFRWDWSATGGRARRGAAARWLGRGGAVPVAWVSLARARVHPRALANLRGGVEVWTTGLDYFLKILKIVFAVWRTLEPLSSHLSPGFISE